MKLGHDNKKIKIKIKKKKKKEKRRMLETLPIYIAF